MIINLAGTLLWTVFIAVLASARTGIQFITFRALQGIAAAMTFPTAISILSYSGISAGEDTKHCFQLSWSWTTIWISSRSSAQWDIRGNFSNLEIRILFVCGRYFSLLLLACWCVPQDQTRKPLTRARLLHGIDWLDCWYLLLIWGFCPMSSHELNCGLPYHLTNSSTISVIIGSLSSIHDTKNVVLLLVASLLAVMFPVWMHHQEKRKIVALIPNSL